MLRPTAALMLCAAAAHAQVWMPDLDWTLIDQTGGVGWIDDALEMMYLETGADGAAGATGFTTTVPASGTVSASLDFLSNDALGDLAAFSINGDWTVITLDPGLHNVVFEAAAGDEIGLWVSADALESDSAAIFTEFALNPTLEIEPCIADFNGDGAIDILDFVAFQSAFTAGDDAADCNDDGALSILDFVCFQGAFGDDCPPTPHKALVIINSDYSQECIDWVNGVNGNNDFGDLASATMDGQNMASVFRAAGLHVDMIENASADEIKEKIKACMPDDDEGSLLIYYVGHGDANEPLPGSPGKGALICPDCSIFTHEDFVEAVAERPQRVKFIMDSCASGAFYKDVKSKQPGARSKSGFFTSTGDLEVCNSEPGLGGYFTRIILDSLDQDDSDTNDDSKVTEGEAYLKVRQQLWKAHYYNRGPSHIFSNLDVVSAGAFPVANNTGAAATKVTITLAPGAGPTRPRIHQTPKGVYVKDMTLDGNVLTITFKEPGIQNGEQILVGVAAAAPDNMGVDGVEWE